MSLNNYIAQTQSLLGFDERMEEYNPADLITFINMARRQTAMQGQCCRWLTPAGGAIENIVVLAGGSGYTNPTVYITPPDAPSGQPLYPNGIQATADAILVADSIASVGLSFGGDGYLFPAAKIVDPTGDGALLDPIVTVSANRTKFGQETYAFEDIDLGADSGASGILAVRNITLLFGNLQYTLKPMSFSDYMRGYRRFSQGYTGQPTVWCQFAQGDQGTIRMFPVPNQEYAMQWDCLIIPQDLIDDDSYDAIPQPWQDAVPFYATYLAILGMAYKRPSIMPLADKYYNTKDGGLFVDMLRRARAFSQPQQMSPIR